MGFDRVDFVSSPGEFAVRGGIIDVFSFAYQHPYRIEFFDQTIERLSCFDVVSQRSISNFEEVKARGGKLFVVGNAAGNMKLKPKNLINLPECDFLLTPILYTVPLQILSYEVALLRGTDIDQPRNLAKSVTVE